MLRPRNATHPYLMIAPTLLFLVVFFILPLGVAGWRSLYRWDLLTPPEFVGGQNYARLLETGEFTRALGITLTYSVVVVAGCLVLGLLLALALNRPGKFVGFVRASVFSAYVVSWVRSRCCSCGCSTRTRGCSAGRCGGLPRAGCCRVRTRRFTRWRG
mgnify:CR=1 FL=1